MSKFDTFTSQQKSILCYSFELSLAHCRSTFTMSAKNAKSSSGYNCSPNTKPVRIMSAGVKVAAGMDDRSFATRHGDLLEKCRRRETNGTHRYSGKESVSKYFKPH